MLSTLRLFSTSTKDYLKKKVAVTCGFIGSKYYGLQYNENVPLPTIEMEILHALNKAGYISDQNAMNTKKVNISRASRTDKGVHAARTVLSLKLEIAKNKFKLPLDIHSNSKSNNTTHFHIEDLAKEVNAFLPPDIRIFDAITTNNGFIAKSVSITYSSLLHLYNI